MNTQPEPTSRRGASGLALALLIVALVGIVAAGAGVMTYESRYRGRIYAGVSVLGIPVGGLEPMVALERVREAVGGAALPAVVLYDGADTSQGAGEPPSGSRWTVGASDLGARLDLEAAIAEAWTLGRRGIFRHDLAARARALWWGYDVVPPLDLEPTAVERAMRRIASRAGNPTRLAQLQVTGLQAAVGEGQAGRELDLAATYAAIEGAVRDALGASAWGRTPRLYAWPVGRTEGARLPTEPLDVALTFRDTLPVSTDLSGAEAAIDALLGAPLILSLPPSDGDTAPPRRWAVDQATLADWLTVTPDSDDGGATVRVGIDRQRVTAYIEGIAATIARPPREPRFDFDPTEHTLAPLTPEQSGLSLDVDAAVERVVAACDGGQREVALPANVVAPRVTRAALEALLPLDLIGEGVSSFVDSSPERLQNIRVATSRFHGLPIPPHTTFSFLEHLGPVTAANGYSESWVIYDNRTILGPGGGVCQVSTTCFRAAFWGGYPIVERSPHFYRVGWYEPPIGLDAAVYSPEVDMVFENDTDTPILIVTEVDEARARLSFRFYGRSAGRKVTMEGPTTSNPRSAGAPVEEVDPSLSPGARVQLERAHDGIDATLVRVIARPGAEPVREEFLSRYQPWPARYRVGPRATSEGDEGT